MMDSELERRISDAIEDGTEQPGSELAPALGEDEEAAAFFEDVKGLEGHLRSWGFEEPPREYWRNFVPRLTGRLGSLDAPELDPLEPPAPDEETAPVEAAPPAEEDSLAALAGLVGRSTVPPAAMVSAGDGDDDDAVIDIGKLRASSLAPPQRSEKDEGLAAPPPDRARGEAQRAPVLQQAPAEPARSYGAYYVGAFVVLLAAAVGYFVLREPSPDGLHDPERGALTGRAEPLAEGQRDEAPRPEQVRDDEVDEGAAPAAAPPGEAGDGEESGDEVAGATAGPSRPARGGASRQPATASGGGAAAPPTPAVSSQPEAPTKAAPAPAAVEPAPAKSGSASLDELLSGATKVPTKQARADVVDTAVSSGEGGSALPDQPSRAQVRRAMGSVAGQVYACRAMIQDTVRVNATVTVASSGSVTSARATGGPEPVNSCVERAVGGARFPPFSQPTFTVTYPFVLSPPEE